MLTPFLDNPTIQTIIVLLALPVLSAVLSFAFGLLAKIPGLPASVKAAIGRVYTSFEAEVTPAHLAALEARIEAVEAGKISAVSLAVEVADRAVTTALSAIQNPVDGTMPAAKQVNQTEAESTK
jgi:hypothetical protein